MDDMFDHGPVTQIRIFNLVFGGTSAMGFVLAMVGLYAVVAFHVSRRTREIGIRMALGAQRSQVLHLVLRQASIPAGAGIAIGLLLSIVARPSLMVAMGRPVSSFDPVMITAVPLTLLLITFIAAAIPARRAAHIDPQKALRQE
jgi:ABC-type antimicrobial peptide transport system permease subunit